MANKIEYRGLLFFIAYARDIRFHQGSGLVVGLKV